MLEDRKSKRKQVFISAEVEFDGTKKKVIVRDVSEVGAKITLRSELYVQKGQKGIFRKDSIETPCEVIWTNDQEYGLKFEQETVVEVSKPNQVFEPDMPYSSASVSWNEEKRKAYEKQARTKDLDTKVLRPIT